jgi:hypothetical protein
MFALPLLGGSWEAFGEHPTAGKLSPAYATYPVGYDEISSLWLKVNTWRIVLWAPVFVITAVAVQRAFAVETATAVRSSVLLLLVLLFTQPIFWIGKFSSGSNDTQVFRWRSVPIFLAVLLSSLGSIAAASASFFVGEPWSVFSIALVPVFSFGAWFVYRWAYNSSTFDLVHEVRKQ